MRSRTTPLSLSIDGIQRVITGNGSIYIILTRPIGESIQAKLAGILVEITSRFWSHEEDCLFGEMKRIVAFGFHVLKRENEMEKKREMQEKFGGDSVVKIKIYLY